MGQSLHRGHMPQLGSFCCGEGGCLEDRMHLSQEAKATHQPDGVSEHLICARSGLRVIVKNTVGDGGMPFTVVQLCFFN